MCSYLENRKQRTDYRLRITFVQKKGLAGVPQGSMDGPLLCDLSINDLVLFFRDVS